MCIAQNKHFFYKEKEQNDKNRDTELALQRKLEKKIQKFWLISFNAMQIIQQETMSIYRH
jgi:hypothetical protein